MARNIPGTIPVEGREFVYVEYSDSDSFRDDFGEIWEIRAGDKPTDGAMMYDEAMITIPDGARFHALTYNRDLARWFAHIVIWCKIKGLRWGKIEDNDLVLCTGERFSLSRCKVEFGA